MNGPPWRELSNTLCLRRNLECAGMPAKMIGTLNGGSGNRWESPEQRRQHLVDRRREHATWSRELRAQHGARSDHQLAARIQELREQEERLWKLCRPDLYA